MTLSSEVVSEGTERAPLSQPSVLSPVPGAYRSEGWETLPELSPDPPAASGPDGSAATRSAAVEQLGRGLPPLPFCAGSPRQSLGRTAVAPLSQARHPRPEAALRPLIVDIARSAVGPAPPNSHFFWRRLPQPREDATCSDGRGGRL